MSRPRVPLQKYLPAISQGQAGVTLESDMGAQIVTQTFVAGSPGSVNIQLNSLKTSNVIWTFVPSAGQSYHYHVYEVTDPTQSAVFVGIDLFAGSSGLLRSNQNLYGKLTILQRA